MKNWLTFIAAIIILTLFFWLGFKAHERFRPCQVITSETIYIYDTMPRSIPSKPPDYEVRIDSIKYRDKEWMDSVIQANKVDTTQILLDYFMYHYYTRTWEDTLVKVTLSDVVTENKFLDATFSYKLLKPVTVINNSVQYFNYSSYLYLGGSVPVNDVKMASTDVYFANKQLLLGVGYIPYSKGVRVTAGFKLIKFNK